MNVNYANAITVAAMCSGGAGTGPILFDYWDSHNCPLAYQILMGVSSTGTNGITGIVGYSVTGAGYARNYVTELFQNYQSYYTITNNVSDPRYNNFQRQLLNLCLDPALPGICETALTSFCKPTSRSQLVTNDTLTSFCGCFVPSDPLLDSHIGGTTGCFGNTGTCQRCEVGRAGCSVIKACDQFCHRSDTVQRANLQNGFLITCPQNVCVINDIVINAENSTVGKGINFTSICGGCQGFGCYCLISGVDISKTAASVGLSEDFGQFCGTDSVCIQGDQKVPCSEINANKIPITEDKKYPSPVLGIALAVIIIIVIILLLFSYIK